MDIVSVIPIQKFWLKEIVKIFPGYDSKKLKFLEDLNCFSCRDGIISKEGAWRLSWSNSEVRLTSYEGIKTDKQCYNTQAAT